MSETSDELRIGLGIQIDTKNIKEQIQGMEPPKITLDIDAKDLKAKAEGIRLKIDVGDFNAKIEQLKKGFRDTGLSADEAQRKVRDVQSAYDSLKSVRSSPEQLVAAEKRLNQELRTTQNELKIAKMEASQFASALQVTKLSNKIQSWLKNNTAATKEAKAAMQQYYEQIQASNGQITKTNLQSIETGYNSINTEMRIASKLGNSTIATLKAGMSKFTNWFGASTIVMGVFHEIRNGIKTIAELDDGLTNINYTMDVTSSQLENIGASSVQMAKDLNTSTSNVLSAVKLYANANETANSILKKAKPAVMLSNITGKSGEDEAKNLQAMQNQFQLADDELMGLTDTIETISANMSYDFADGIAQITEGIQQSGAAAKAAGMDYKRYMALLGAGIESTGLSGSQLANAYKTMMARTTSASKASIANGEVTEDDISNAEKSLRSVNIEVREANDSFYDFDQTMGAIYEKLDELSEVDLSKLAYDIAGVRQSSIFRSMIQSYGTYLNLAKEAENSQGKALEVQEKQAESIKGRLGELKSTGESIWNNILNSDTLKTGISLLTTVVKLLDKITDFTGGFGTVGLGLGAFLGANNAGGAKMSAPTNDCFKMPATICVLWDTGVFILSDVKYTLVNK